MPGAGIVKRPALPWALDVNQRIMRFYFGRFMAKYLPAYGVDIVREDEDGLGYDFTLHDVEGNKIDKSRAQKVFDEFIRPYWPVYSEFETSGNVYVIHVNLDRQVSLYSEIAIIAGAGFVAWEVVKNLGRKSI